MRILNAHDLETYDEGIKMLKTIGDYKGTPGYKSLINIKKMLIAAECFEDLAELRKLEEKLEFIIPFEPVK